MSTDPTPRDMSPALREEMRQRFQIVSAQAELRYKEMKSFEKSIEPMQKQLSDMAYEWCKVYQEANQIMVMLGEK